MRITLDEQLGILKVAEAVTNRQMAQQRRQRERIITQHVFPHLPKSLTTLFELKSRYTGYNINLTFSPIVELTGEMPVGNKGSTMARALGLITKTVAGLRNGGWEIVEDPIATVHTGSLNKAIKVEITGNQNFNKTYQILHITFNGFDDTPNCHLVEKDVIVAAVYTPERTEKRLVVQCDQPEEVTA